MQRDYYEVLGVSRTCEGGELKSAFRKLAMEHHPDRNNGCEEAEGRFKEINEAYSVLSDAQKRAAYDQFGHAGVNGMGGMNGGAGFGDVVHRERDVPRARRIARRMALPVRFVGLGEGVEDLEPFDAEAYAEALIN